MSDQKHGEFRFDGQVALITGSGAGLGRAHACELARRGATVVINDIAHAADGGPLSELVAAEIRDKGFAATAVPGDVGIEAGAIGLVEQTLDQHGRLDILVNNAGAGGSGVAQDVSTEDFSDTLRVHLFGMFWTMRAALQQMRTQDYGRIINTTSALGVFGAPASLPYVTAKAGIVGMTRAASLDNRDRNIRVNSLAPVANTGMSIAYFKTQPQLDTRLLSAAFVAPAVAYLAHRDCELNGETLAAGGGRVARLFSAAVPGLASATLTTEEIAGGLGEVLDTNGFRILGSSVEQYELLPHFDHQETSARR